MKKRWCAPLRSEADGEPDVEHRIRLEALQLILESRLLRRGLALHCRALRGREPAAIGIERRFGRSHEHDAQVRVEVDARAAHVAPADAEIRRGAPGRFYRGVEAARYGGVAGTAGCFVLVGIQDDAAGEAKCRSKRVEIEQAVQVRQLEMAV